MRLQRLETIFRALNQAGVRYVVVGGLAVIAHGLVRGTKDIDLVLAFEAENLTNGVKALEHIGMRPRIPVSAEEFAKVENRERWVREKNMVVFQMSFFERDDAPVDIFIAPPFDFELERQRAFMDEIAPDLMVPFVHIEQLIAMKKAAGRPKDIEDVRILSRLVGMQSEERP
jgi:predicted nucleotidyltransferase